MVKKIGIVHDPIYIEHMPGTWHPESPQRLSSIYEMLKNEEVKELYESIQPRKATREEIQLIHSSRHFDRIAATEGKAATFLDPDTITSERSFEAALYAVGGVLSGIDRIMEEKIEAPEGYPGEVFALIRPPGHHAEADWAKGFCLFNNIAIGTQYAIEHYGIERVLIADWDLHHGNGTQHAFEQDSRVLYFSTHQYPYYPGTGSMNEVGIGEGSGYTINVPLFPGHGDEEYYRIFKSILVPVAELFKPQLVMVSAGFDTYFGDPLGGMQLSPTGFSALARLLQTIARKHAGSRMLLTLEGGYHIKGQTQSIEAIIRTFAGVAPVDNGFAERELQSIGKMAERTIESVMAIQREYWSCF